jgi:pimeloyl-ACP methyl ester carboxylesterase
MTIIAQVIADRLILKPTRHKINAVGKERRVIPVRKKGSLEVWTQRVAASSSDDVDVFVLKFAGTAGRAERATYHPMDYWSDLRAELWSVNPFGYGGSSGVASVKSLAECGQAAYEAMANVADGRPIFVFGNSLGTVTALHLSANYDVAGLVLRNPPPLRQLIVGQHGWWNLWIGAMLIAQKVPYNLCSIRNAARSNCPAVFLSSRKDEIVPVAYQERIMQAYAGPKRVVCLANAKHATSLNLAEQRDYRGHLEWLRHRSIKMPAATATRELVGAV